MVSVQDSGEFEKPRLRLVIVCSQSLKGDHLEEQEELNLQRKS